MPFRLRTGDIQTPWFPAGKSETYRLLVASQQRLGFSQLNCLLGIHRCSGVQEAIDVSWTVWNEGGTVETSGESSNWRGGFYHGDEVAREIGAFAAREGRNYMVRLSVRRDASELDPTGPRLLVETSPGAWKDVLVGHAIQTGLTTIIPPVLAAIGLLIALAPPLWKRSLLPALRNHAAPVDSRCPLAP